MSFDSVTAGCIIDHMTPGAIPIYDTTKSSILCIKPPNLPIDPKFEVVLLPGPRVMLPLIELTNCVALGLCIEFLRSKLPPETPILIAIYDRGSNVRGVSRHWYQGHKRVPTYLLAISEGI